MGQLCILVHLRCLLYEPTTLYTYLYITYTMNKTKVPAEKAVTKSITILPRHQQFIEENTIKLSKFVQKKIDEEIKNRTAKNE